MKLTIINKTGGNIRIPGTDTMLMFATKKTGREVIIKPVVIEGEAADRALEGIEKMKENGSVKKWIEKGLLVIKKEEEVKKEDEKGKK